MSKMPRSRDWIVFTAAGTSLGDTCVHRIETAEPNTHAPDMFSILTCCAKRFQHHADMHAAIVTDRPLSLIRYPVCSECLAYCGAATLKRMEQ